MEGSKRGAESKRRIDVIERTAGAAGSAEEECGGGWRRGREGMGRWQGKRGKKRVRLCVSV